MELDDMKLAWQSLERQMARRYALDLEGYKDRKLAAARSGLRPLWAGLWIQLAGGIATTALSASFWIAHRHAPQFVVSGLLLQAYGVMLIVFAALELRMIGEIDYAAPVVTLQRRLAHLRAWRLRVMPVFAVTGCFIWVPLVLAVFEAWLGADIYANAPEVVAIFVACALACLVAMWALRRGSRDPRRARLAQYLDDSSVGHALNRAHRVLDEIARFEKE